MGRFRTKPVVIEALQFTGAPSFAQMCREWGDAFAAAASYDEKANGLAINTLEGGMRADPGDWIVKGTRGEFYPVKPDVFETKYEPA
jgi:hypothetical protein